MVRFDSPSEPPRSEEGRAKPHAPRAERSRRDIVRSGIKLAFVAPVLSTFFAADAYAGYSCYPAGHTCLPPGQGWEECCPGLNCSGSPKICG